MIGQYPDPMTQTWDVPLDAEQALNWPVEQVAMHLLHEFKRARDGQTRHDFANAAIRAYQHNGIRQDEATKITRALVEAYDWLLVHGLLTEGLTKGEFAFITRKGLAVLDESDPVAYVRAEARLDVDLHPSIARRVRNQFLLGEYEQAALIAMREVEIRVRRLSNADAGDIGVKLMRQAFGATGPLTDAQAEKGEQDGMRELFSGAIAVFRNPVSHREVEYDNPTVASEVIFLADLLLRILDGRDPVVAGP